MKSVLGAAIILALLVGITQARPLQAPLPMQAPPMVEETAPAPVPIVKTCECSAQCVCGCQEGAPCTCGEPHVSKTYQPISYQIHQPVQTYPTAPARTVYTQPAPAVQPSYQPVYRPQYQPVYRSQPAQQSVPAYAAPSVNRLYSGGTIARGVGRNC